MSIRHPNNRAAPGVALTIACASLLAFGLTPNAGSATAPAQISVAVPPSLANGLPVTCYDGTLPRGALYLVCKPAVWNGDLVIYAHGYVAPGAPLALPDDKVDGVPVYQIVAQMGYAFATTSYRANGLVVPLAVDDLVKLAARATTHIGQPDRVLLAGVSEGGLITTLAVEQHPGVFDGGLAACGPVGDFRKQIDYFGDFFVVFNYFFPGVLGGASPVGVPPAVMNDWDSVYVPRVLAALAANPGAVRQLLKVTGAPVDPSDLATVGETVLGILWYDIFSTNNAIAVLGGQPFDNSWRWYSGSDNDWRLNWRVQRVGAAGAALREIDRKYQTTGRLSRPLVTLHTTGDPIVPYWHEPLYWWKALFGGSALLHTNLPVPRYGHCSFTVNEVLTGFALLVLKVTGRELLFGENLEPAFRPAALPRFETKPVLSAGLAFDVPRGYINR